MPELYWCLVLEEYSQDINPDANGGTGLCDHCGGSMEDDHRRI